MDNSKTKQLNNDNIKTTTTTPTIRTSDSDQQLNNKTSDVSDDILEILFQRYSIKQKRAAFECFLIASMLFDIWVIFVAQGSFSETLGLPVIFLILNIGLTIILRLYGNCQFRGIIWEVSPYLAWLYAIMQLFFQLFFKNSVTPRDSLGWAILFNFLIYVTLPVPLKYSGLILGFGTFAIYINTIFGLAKIELYFWNQQFANYLMLFAASIIGIQSYYIGESKQRRAFLEAKQSLEVKMLIEEQSAEQERLLLSVLPEHVAVKVRQDLGSNQSEQFKKIYMSRHENVSILYADIVGFTAISSTYSAQDLVKMLNDLFARFDRLAEKYDQLRIKILGDCYYCISGAPIERADHAVLCVYMGLAMVKAIKYVQYKTRSPVDMRVGIHTGAVLAGILGQRQWQFDVYSKDVELANKMESSGLAGRVHISEKTLNFLNGEFEIEPAYGEKREEALRIAGLKTYFITKVVKSFTPITGSKNCLTKADEDIMSSIDLKDEDEGGGGGGDTLGINCTTGENTIKANDDGDGMTKIVITSSNENNIKLEDFKQRLRTELVSRDGHGELTRSTTFLLTFKNGDLERAYTLHREPLSSMPLLSFMIVQFVCVVYSSFIFQSSFLHFLLVILSFIIITIIIILSVAETFPNIFKERTTKLSKYLNGIVCFRKCMAIIVIILLCGSNLLDMLFCEMNRRQTLNNNNGHRNNNITTTINHHRVVVVDDVDDDQKLFTSIVCTFFPSYFSSFSVLILIAISIIGNLSHIIKCLLMLIFVGLHCSVNLLFMDEDYYEGTHTLTYLPLQYSLSFLLIAVTIALGHLARHMDKEDRVIFTWTKEVADQKERASDMRHRNEALIYNILPIHVAEYFMKNKTRSHDDLYSQSYAEVGVLFASMPNFSDFYSEESVNNQGLECLRFLNEVISDFDALLEIPKYQNVIKIKTIGSTYMAASGLNPSKQVQAEDPIAIRWKHLSILVDFALDLKKALQSINEQSFNHFVLKMGINHGPITAGVIGARKPHYDIWGNTVNVASRMESTGKAGAVQVTEETCHILQIFGYTFEQRGLVFVKGKGQLMTYYLQGKNIILSPARKSAKQVNTLESVPECINESSARKLINDYCNDFDSQIKIPTVDNCLNNDGDCNDYISNIEEAATAPPPIVLAAINNHLPNQSPKTSLQKQLNFNSEILKPHHNHNNNSNNNSNNNDNNGSNLISINSNLVVNLFNDNNNKCLDMTEVNTPLLLLDEINITNHPNGNHNNNNNNLLDDDSNEADILITEN